MAKLRLLLVLALVGVALAQQTITLEAVIRDFQPGGDFETMLGDDRGSVAKHLDQDSKPFLAVDHSSTITSKASFAEWYRDVPTVNIRININITLDEVSPGIYSYSNPSFFPINNEGWGNTPGWNENFHFTTEIHTKFTYLGNETFTFTGDDDVYVFINDILAIDLGGVHSEESQTIVLNETESLLNITVGGTYNLAVFHAERHTDESHFRIDTSLVLTPSTPPPTDPGKTVSICGVYLDNFCAGKLVTQCPQTPEFTYLESSGDSIAFSDFNAISFGNYNAKNGDVQGRLAVHQDCTLENYNVGLLIQSAGASIKDRHVPYSVVIGHDGTATNVEVNPDGDNSPYYAAKEDVFAGHSWTANNPQLQARATGSCGSTTNCLDSDFANALAFYTAVSDAFAAIASNVQYVNEPNNAGLNITCDDSSAASYYINIPATTFNQVNSYIAPSNCNPNAQFVITITGTEDVTFGDDTVNFRDPEYVLYNVPGSRTIHARSQKGNLLAPNCNLIHQNGVWTGLVIVGSLDSQGSAHQINRVYCPAPKVPPTPPPATPLCPWFETECSGLVLPVGASLGSFRDYLVVSFGSFASYAADVQGRVAVRDNFHAPGYAIGEELQTSPGGPERELPYALVVGGNAYFNNSHVYPDGSNVPYPGAQEFIFVGETFVGSDDLRALVTGTCNTQGCLNQYFDAAQNCYSTIQQVLADTPDNAHASVTYGGLYVTCNDITASRYTLTVQPDTFSQITYYTISNCNFQAQWVINVPGSSGVTMTGDVFPANAGAVVYNFLGTGRTITFSTSFSGNILAPNNIIYQSQGTLTGKVVAGDIALVHQVNIVHCPKPATLTLVTYTDCPIQAGDTKVCFNSDGGFIPGDLVSIGGSTDLFNITVVNEIDHFFEFASPIPNSYGNNTKLSVFIENPNLSRVVLSSTPTPTPTQQQAASDSSFVRPVVAVVLFLLALLSM